MTGGKGREASASEASGESDADLQQDIDERKGNEYLDSLIYRIFRNEAICDI
jgi:hypothetical protein